MTRHGIVLVSESGLQIVPMCFLTRRTKIDNCQFSLFAIRIKLNIIIDPTYLTQHLSKSAKIKFLFPLSLEMTCVWLSAVEVTTVRLLH